jgi:hypothetical protein
MPTPLKPCEGKISDQTHEALRRNRNREQWAAHPCETCGRTVGVELIMGKWQPERHWPSVAYIARKSAAASRPTVPTWQSRPEPARTASAD